jgi:gliding motility-associated lipoprotein GldH
MIKKFFIIFFITIGFISCGKKPIFEKHEKIDNSTWNKDKVFFFEVPITDTRKNYDVFIAVRHSEVYPFDNLYVGVDIYTPSGDKRSKDYYLEMRNEDRSYKGDVLGDIWDVKVMIMKNASFNSKGIHKFEIHNLMQYVNVPDVMEIGLIVEKHN